ncbi:MAG: hypothetical protein HFJ45_01210 [Clostridia bacterium]|nr:hypothetical protein [Clostridia bacterium]
MKIGIDIDGVILDYEKGMLANAEIFDLERCGGNGKIYKDKYFAQDKYDWTEEEKKTFINENLGTISEQSSIMAGAKYVLNKLKEMGHELIIVSSRGKESDKMIDIVMEKLNKENIKFNKYYWKVSDKLQICIEENIDIMIDDSPNICKKIKENNLISIYFRGIRGEHLDESEYLKEVSNWGEIYRYFINKNMNI